MIFVIEPSKYQVVFFLYCPTVNDIPNDGSAAVQHNDATVIDALSKLSPQTLRCITTAANNIWNARDQFETTSS